MSQATIRKHYSDKEPSDIFTNALVDSSGIVADCEFCGRTFFEDDDAAGDWETGELEELRRKAQEDSDRYRGVDHVARATIGGKTGIVGCPCNGLRPYEDLFWDNRKLIMNYFSAKVKDLVERALEDEGLADQAMADLAQAEKAQATVRCPKCLKFVSLIAMNEGGICVKCWERVKQEAEAEKLRQEVIFRDLQEDAERKRLEAEQGDDNLPF